MEQFWRTLMEMGIKEIELHVGEVEQHGDAVFEVSRATLRSTDGQILDEMKYIVIWKQENGEWKLHRDIFNSSRPAQG